MSLRYKIRYRRGKTEIIIEHFRSCVLHKLQGRAKAMVDYVVDLIRDRGVGVATGRFGAMMEVELVNDGPVTLILDR